jgi:(S)-ureidoglycine aminohydrolase
MFNLGNTRSSNERDHLLQTPDTFVRAPLPGMRNATAIVHIGPARGAAFTQYTVEFEANGTFESGANQMFVYVLDGSVEVGTVTAGPGSYAYVPAGANLPIRTVAPARAVFIERAPGHEVAAFRGDEHTAPSTALGGDEALQVRTLFPDDPAYDFAVNTMAYQPGATLPMVEIHVMEHGLLMLEGEGIYRLGDRWYPVQAGDFIWMAPYCPQWFGALGKKPAKYLIYKDWNQHPLPTK